MPGTRLCMTLLMVKCLTSNRPALLLQWLLMVVVLSLPNTAGCSTAANYPVQNGATAAL